VKYLFRLLPEAHLKMLLTCDLKDALLRFPVKSVAPRPAPAPHSSDVGEQGWQLMTSRRARRATAKSTFQDSSVRHARRARFLSKMQCRCFNCLSTSHSVADCHSQTKCWRCLRPGHLSSSCCRRPSAPSRAAHSRTTHPHQAAYAPLPPPIWSTLICQATLSLMSATPPSLRRLETRSISLNHTP
jgi:hypothetical protein